MLDPLRDLLARGGVAVLTGAGISTESGIPDYRGPTGVLRRARPMDYTTFVTDPAARQRYWARSHLGWRRIAEAHPNAGHRAVAALQHAGSLAGIITQNVDGLHQAAGAIGVTELHGGLDRVVCLCCDSRWPRADVERRLAAANPDFAAATTAVNPDGDVDLDASQVAGFVPVTCPLCRGDLKPDVVFFGETVPRARVERCRAMVDRADALLVLGSSLQVQSGFRFVRQAAARGIPIVIVNRGTTRGDALATVKIDAALGPVLSALAA
ncbi:MAG: NAD-dependent protein deacetylase [Jatrophihabitans sp.]|nr:MAG: NAD-dependent protein deacetylase [Jatrophihabitans sp.]